MVLCLAGTSSALASNGDIYAGSNSTNTMGELLEETGSEGYGDGQFSGIQHIAVKGNMIYAVESTAGRVQYFRFSLRNRAGVAPLMLLRE